MQTAQIIDLISAVRDRIHAEMVRQLSERNVQHLAPSHTVLLARLLEQDGLTMMELANGVGRDKSTITALVKKLSSLGLVTTGKDPADQRVTRVTLTEEARKLRSPLEAIHHDLTSQVFQGFNWQDRTQLIELLERVQVNFEVSSGR